MPVSVDHRPSPKLRRGGVVHDGAHVVVTLCAERSAEYVVLRTVPASTVRREAMSATNPSRSGVADTTGTSRVDGTETGSGQREEDSRSLGHDFWNALATLEAGLDQMAGIASIDVGARGTAHRAPGTTGLEHDAIGERCAGKHDSTIAGARGRVTTQSNRVATPSAADSLTQEGVDLITASMTTEGFEHGVIRCIHARESGPRM
jgi:hypothetical protein